MKTMAYLIAGVGTTIIMGVIEIGMLTAVNLSRIAACIVDRD